MTAGVPLLLVDGHNLLFRACFGTPAQIMSRDQDGRRDITTQFMFFALLRKGINDELGLWPEVIVVFDGQDGAAHRQDADPGYKATRPATAEALRPILALPDVKTGLTIHGITWIEIDDAEADDVIATLAAADPAREVLIASTDQDYYQLLRGPSPRCGGVRVLNTAMRPGHRFIGAAQLTARYNVTPRQYPDFRALCGDASDGIPGIRGVGPKTAARLLANDLALDDLPLSGRLSGRTGKAVLQAWDQLLTWRDLIRMHTDIPAPHHPTGHASPQLPPAPKIVGHLGLW
jgi:DNA polymerase-1